VFGLEGDQALYVMHLASLQQDVGTTFVHSVVLAPIQQPSLHILILTFIGTSCSQGGTHWVELEETFLLKPSFIATNTIF